MKISIVTPTFRRMTYVEDTIRSIVTQAGDFDLQYVIKDGGGSDDLVAMGQRWEATTGDAAFETRCNNLSLSFISETDNGMYAAINQGFTHTDGEVMAWLNSDDMYHNYALQTVAHIFQKFPQVEWLTGIPNSYNTAGARVGFDTWPVSYSRSFIRRGFYDVQYANLGFNWIQQESTFWRRSLWEKVGGLDESYRYAADFDLWQRFAEHAPLYRLYSFLGGFRVHEDQITADPSKYRSELSNEVPPPHGLRWLRRLVALGPRARRQFFNAKQGKPWLPMLGLEFADLIGPTIEWSHEKQEWQILQRGIV